MSSSSAATARAAESISEFVYEAPGTAGSASTDEKQASPGAPGPEASNLLQVSKQEVSRLVAEARAEGFRQGQNEAQKQYEQAVAEQNSLLQSALSSFEQERATYYAKVEVKLVHFALAIAAKILHREAQVDPLVVAGLVKVVLERMQQTTKAVIRIRPEEAASWRHYFNTSPDLEVVEDPAVEPGGCRIETELGVAEMGLDAQLKEVENGFFDLLAQRPGGQ
jgi:flagellar assembly protein FliH